MTSLHYHHSLILCSRPALWTGVLRAESDARSFGKQTWFRLEGPNGEAAEYAPAEARPPAETHVRAHVTGAYVNYRVEDFVRGHGNSQRAGQWVAAPKAASTRILMESLGVDALRADADKWKATRDGCLAPCLNATSAAEAARHGGVGYSEVCWKHYAEPHCAVLLAAHGPDIGVGGGEAAHLLKARWARLDCEKYVQRPTPPPKAALPVARAAPAAQLSAASAGGPDAAAGAQCAPLVDNVLLLLVSDRPNQFLCHYFESAMLHGLRPTVLGWDSTAWASPDRKPWTYYLGGKLVLPLEYLDKCHYPDDALVHTLPLALTTRPPPRPMATRNLILPRPPPRPMATRNPLIPRRPWSHVPHVAGALHRS